MEALTRLASFEAPSRRIALARSLLATGAFGALFVPAFTFWFELGAA